MIKSPEERLGDRRAFLAKLDTAVALADQLGKVVSTAFPSDNPQANNIDFTGMSVDDRIRLGDHQAGELEALAYTLAPDAAGRRIEAAMSTDEDAKQKTNDLIAQFSKP